MNKSLANKILNVFRFPRKDLESHWWHRLAKVLVIITTLIALLLAVRGANEYFKPYLVYSLQSDSFKQYTSTYRVEDCSLKTLCGGDEDSVVFAYELSGVPGAYTYVDDAENQGESTYIIFQKLQDEGVLANLKAVDLQNNFYGNYYKIAYIVLVPFLWYLFVTQVIYRIIAYILVGKKNKHVV